MSAAVSTRSAPHRTPVDAAKSQVVPSTIAHDPLYPCVPVQKRAPHANERLVKADNRCERLGLVAQRPEISVEPKAHQLFVTGSPYGTAVEYRLSLDIKPLQHLLRETAKAAIRVFREITEVVHHLIQHPKARGRFPMEMKIRNRWSDEVYGWTKRL